MLLKLFAEQVVDKWDDIFPAINAALPSLEEDSKEYNSREDVLMRSFLKGNLVCWLMVSGEDKEKIIGVLTTSIIIDPGTEMKSLFIYSIFAYQFLSIKSWVTVLEPLMKYARREGCVNILAFSDVEKIINIMNEVGADTSQKVLRLEVF